MHPRKTQSTTFGPPFPLEIYLRIFHLCAQIRSSREIALLRLVCRAWKPLIEEVLVKQVSFSKTNHAYNFSKWINATGLNALVKDCTILPPNTDVTTKLTNYTSLLRSCPNLRKLTIKRLYTEAPFHLALASCFPRLEELNIAGSGNEVVWRSRFYPAFCDLLPFISGLNFLKSLSMEGVEFLPEDEPLPFSLTSVCLRECTDISDVIAKVFQRSRLTIRSYTFTSSDRDKCRRGKESAPLPDARFLDSSSPLNYLGLSTYTPLVYDCRVHGEGLATLCIAQNNLPEIWDRFGATILSFPRLVIFDMDRKTTLPQQEWSALKWLHIQSSHTHNPSDFESVIHPLGRFVRVLALHNVHFVPSDFGHLFPQLQALDLFHTSSGAAVTFPELGWFVPTLRAFRKKDIVLRPNEVKVISEALVTKRSPVLNLLVTNKDWDRDEYQDFCILCEDYGVEIVTVGDPFIEWAQAFALA